MITINSTKKINYKEYSKEENEDFMWIIKIFINFLNKFHGVINENSLANLKFSQQKLPKQWSFQFKLSFNWLINETTSKITKLKRIHTAKSQISFKYKK